MLHLDYLRAKDQGKHGALLRRVQEGARESMTLTYEQWLKRVDEIMWLFHGLSLDDVPDWRTKDAYDQGMTPSAAAKKAARMAR